MLHIRFQSEMSYEKHAAEKSGAVDSKRFSFLFSNVIHIHSTNDDICQMPKPCASFYSKYDYCVPHVDRVISTN